LAATVPSILFVAFSAISAVAENPEMAMDKMTDEALRVFRGSEDHPTTGA